MDGTTIPIKVFATFFDAVNKGNFRVAPDGNEYWSGRGEVPTDADPDNPPLVLEDALPKGIRAL